MWDTISTHNHSMVDFGIVYWFFLSVPLTWGKLKIQQTKLQRALFYLEWERKYHSDPNKMEKYRGGEKTISFVKKMPWDCGSMPLHIAIKWLLSQACNEVYFFYSLLYCSCVCVYYMKRFIFGLCFITVKPHAEALLFIVDISRMIHVYCWPIRVVPVLWVDVLEIVLSIIHHSYYNENRSRESSKQLIWEMRFETDRQENIYITEEWK